MTLRLDLRSHPQKRRRTPQGARRRRETFELIEPYLLSADRLNGDHARSRSWRRVRRTPGWNWTYVRDDFGGRHRPTRYFTPHAIGAANIRRGTFKASPGSSGLTPIAGSMSSSPRTQADAGHGRLLLGALPESVLELAGIAKNARRGRSARAISPVALAAVRRIDHLFEIER